MPFRTLPGKRVMNNFLRKTYSVRKMSLKAFTQDKLCDSFNTINSYLGFLSHYACYHLRKNALNRKGMYRFFYFKSDFLKAIYSSHIKKARNINGL